MHHKAACLWAGKQGTSLYSEARACSRMIMRKICAMLRSFWFWSPRACASMRATSKGWFLHGRAPAIFKERLAAATRTSKHGVRHSCKS